MRTITKVAVAAILGMSVLSTAAMADSAKGQKLYSKKLKKVCGKTGAVFAGSHSQDEWESAKEEGTLTDMMVAECPSGEDIIKSDKFQKKYMSHIYDFCYEFANDSGNVPSC
jgi:hypothetical protein